MTFEAHQLKTENETLRRLLDARLSEAEMAKQLAMAKVLLADVKTAMLAAGWHEDSILARLNEATSSAGVASLVQFTRHELMALDLAGTKLCAAIEALPPSEGATNLILLATAVTHPINHRLFPTT